MAIDYEKTEENNRHGPWLKCRCSCGTEKSVLYHHLISGHSVSCGCHNKTKSIKDLTGKKFGKLTVEYMVGSTNKGYVIWHCRCECGNECEATSKNLLRGHKLSCGCLQSKNEEKIAKILSKLKVDYKTQFVISDLKNPVTDGTLKFDFAIYNKEGQIVMFVEFDGIHHFRVTRFSANQEKMTERFNQQKECDKAKDEYCKKNGFSLLRIPYICEDDVEDIILSALKEKGVV